MKDGSSILRLLSYSLARARKVKKIGTGGHKINKAETCRVPKKNEVSAVTNHSTVSVIGEDEPAYVSTLSRYRFIWRLSLSFSTGTFC